MSVSFCRLQNLFADQSPQPPQPPTLPPSPSIPRVITPLLSYFLAALAIIKQSKLFSLSGGSWSDLWTVVPGTTRTPHISFQRTIRARNNCLLSLCLPYLIPLHCSLWYLCGIWWFNKLDAWVDGWLDWYVLVLTE